MPKMSKMEVYIKISKLIDLGEDELAGKMLEIVADGSLVQSGVPYASSFTPKDTRDINAAINRMNKSIRRTQ